GPDRTLAETTLRAAAALPPPRGDERGFAAIGLAHLLLETLCDAMGHDRLLDASEFWRRVQTAARSESPEEGRASLAGAAELLRIAREGMTSSEMHLMQWLQIRTPAQWPDLRKPSHPFAVFGEAATLGAIQREYPTPEPFPAEQVDLCIGALVERDEQVLPVESQLWNLRQARLAAREQLGREPLTFACYRSVWGPQSPSWLQHAGYTSAITTTFDNALAPSRYTTIVHWPGHDGRSLPTLTKDPLKLADPGTFFNLGYHLYQSLTHDSTPTLAFLQTDAAPAVGAAEWDALAELAPVFGRWTGVGQYLADVSAGDYAGPASPDEFFTDTLDDRVSVRSLPNPVSSL
ncbi:MAG: hypothetical protein ACRCZF_27505, partial [Gemmataceae bacterium]